jgi:hypothetical protein
MGVGCACCAGSSGAACCERHGCVRFGGLGDGMVVRVLELVKMFVKID